MGCDRHHTLMVGGWGLAYLCEALNLALLLHISDVGPFPIVSPGFQSEGM